MSRKAEIEYNKALAKRDEAWAALRTYKEELQRLSHMPARRWDMLPREELIRRALRTVVGELQWREAAVDHPSDPSL